MERGAAGKIVVTDRYDLVSRALAAAGCRGPPVRCAQASATWGLSGSFLSRGGRAVCPNGAVRRADYAFSPSVGIFVGIRGSGALVWTRTIALRAPFGA